MTPEEKALLENTYKLVKENNELLRSLKRRAKFSTALKSVYWALIILLSFGAFYFIQPYVDMLRGLAPGSGSATPNTQSSYAQQLQDLLK